MLDPQIPLQVKPIEVASPLQSVGQIMQMRGIMTQQLLHQAEISRANAQTQEFQAVADQRKRDLESTKKLQNVLMDPANHELLGKGDFSPIYKAGISPNIATPAIENLQKQQQTAIALQKGKADQLAAGHALLGQTIAGLDKDDTVAADQWNAALPVLAQSHPEIASELTHLTPGPSFRQELGRIAAANGVARSIYENAAKLDKEKAETAASQANADKTNAELPGIKADAEKKGLVTQAMKDALADPTKGAAAIDAALDPAKDPETNRAYKAAYTAAISAGNMDEAAGVVKQAAAHAALISPAARAAHVQQAVDTEKAVAPLRNQAEIAKEKVLIPLRMAGQLNMELEKAKRAPNGFGSIIEPAARARAESQYDAQNKEALTKLQETNRLQGLITAAQGGNKAAPALIPIQELKQFVPRINRNELQAVSSQAGDLVDQVQGFVSHYTEGQPIPAAILQAMYKLGDINKQATLQNYKLGVATLNAAHQTTVPPVDFEKILGSVTPGAKTIRARDPQGGLHEAPEGTTLPAGWKLEGK